MFGLFLNTSVTFDMKISGQGLICVGPAFAGFKAKINIFSLSWIKRYS